MLRLAPLKLRFGFGLVFLDAPSQFFDNWPAAFDLAQSRKAFDEKNSKAMLFGPARPQFFGECRSLTGAVSIAISPRQVVFEFANAFVDVFLLIRTGRCDITQFNELFE